MYCGSGLICVMKVGDMVGFIMSTHVEEGGISQQRTFSNKRKTPLLATPTRTPTAARVNLPCQVPTSEFCLSITRPFSLAVPSLSQLHAFPSVGKVILSQRQTALWKHVTLDYWVLGQFLLFLYFLYHPIMRHFEIFLTKLLLIISLDER